MRTIPTLVVLLCDYPIYCQTLRNKLQTNFTFSNGCTINSKINGTPISVYLPIITHGYVILWASKFGFAKIECSFEMGP